MSRNNHVFQVLVTSGNQAPAALNSALTAILPGQIGVYDADTNLAINATSTVRDFYVAVGLGVGTTSDVIKSRGFKTQARNIVYATNRAYQAPVAMKVILKNYTAECETEYGIKLELRNQEIYQMQGYNGFTKTYAMKTSCCSGCEPTCPSGDANEITRQLLININNDPSGLVSAQAVARTAITAANVPGLVGGNIAAGAVVSDVNLTAIMAFNAAQATPATHIYTDLVITAAPGKLNPSGDINLKYFAQRGTVIIASKAGFEGFKCTGTVETLVAPVMEQGAGYDLRQLEYFAKGWDESPYRVSALNGVSDNKNYNSQLGVNYDQIVLSYDQVQKNAWLEYQNPEATYIAIPAADTTTKTALKLILNAILAKEGFKAIA